MPLKTKLFQIIIIIWLLSLGGMVQAQQEKGQGDMAGGGRSPSEYNSYMGGKEHYLTDSPHYMAGKKHYLEGDPFSDSKKMGQGKEQIPLERGEKISEERKKPEESRVQIEIHVTSRDTPNEYGVIYLPLIRPKHNWGAVSPPPNVDPNSHQTGNFNPNVGGGFHQGAIKFR